MVCDACETEMIEENDYKHMIEECQACQGTGKMYFCNDDYIPYCLVCGCNMDEYFRLEDERETEECLLEECLKDDVEKEKAWEAHMTEEAERFVDEHNYMIDEYEVQDDLELTKRKLRQCLGEMEEMVESVAKEQRQREQRCDIRSSPSSPINSLPSITDAFARHTKRRRCCGRR